ncbi:pyrophosphatase PpaX [Cohnella candidum]|uniref:Pyrophosphatase PpaX n=1 Tax=Cohnella candidum TaxID=2674991 RepID=A0A3G3K3J2_9BACL|nr:pyrophosphatase PpaX [Cohnella candidum]AYQ74721.1 pyrophosphatase PpaX [Cohnella candidum]
MTKEIKAVLFDLDGTIVDTNELIIQSFLHALKGTVSEDFGREHIIPSMGLPLSDQLRLFSGLEDVTALTQSYREYNYLKHDEMVVLFPGVAEVVRRLKAQGIRMGVVTTKMRPTTERALRMFGLFEHMDIIITLDDVQHAKPHPEPVQKAMEAIGAEPVHTAMVGDSTVDMESAIRAGAMPIGVAWSLKGQAVLEEAGAALVIHRMEELLTLCGIEGAEA